MTSLVIIGHLMLYLKVLGQKPSHPGVIDPEELDSLRCSGSQGYILDCLSMKDQLEARFRL